MITLRVLIVLLVVAVLTGGCASHRSASNRSGGQSSTSAPTSFAAPATEGTGPEQPQAPVNQPNVSLPALPIGPPSAEFGPDAASQCISVNFSGNGSPPAGLTVTRADISGDGFTFGGDACSGGDRPTCGDGASFAEGCEVPITWDTESTKADLTLTFHADCSAIKQPYCLVVGPETLMSTPMELIGLVASSSGDTSSGDTSSGDTSSGDTSSANESSSPAS